MFSEPVTVAGDLDDDGVMQQPVQECGGNHVIAEQLALLAKTPVGGEDDGARDRKPITRISRRTRLRPTP